MLNPPPYTFEVLNQKFCQCTHDIGGVASVLASCAVDRWLELQSGQTKDYKIVIKCMQH